MRETASIRVASAKISHWVEKSSQGRSTLNTVVQWLWNSVRCSAAVVGIGVSVEESRSGGSISGGGCGWKLFGGVVWEVSGVVGRGGVGEGGVSGSFTSSNVALSRAKLSVYC